MTFSRKSLQQKSAYRTGRPARRSTVFKYLTMLFLGASCVLWMTQAFDINPSLNNAVQYIQQIFLTTDGSNTSATGISLDGTNGDIKALNTLGLGSAVFSSPTCGLGTCGLYLLSRDVYSNGGDASFLNGDFGIGYDVGASTTGGHLYVLNNVGIGTVTPAEKLEVNGDVQIDTLLNKVVLGTDSNGKIIASTAGNIYNFMSGVYSSGNIYNLISGFIDTGYWTGAVGINDIRNINIGNVGIGTTNPRTKLDVIGDLRIDPTDSQTTNTGMYVGYVSIGGTYRGLIHSKRSGAESDIIIAPYGGNVGIGTDTPLERLHVANGNIRISNLTSAPVLGTTGNGNIIPSTSGDVYNYISGFVAGPWTKTGSDIWNTALTENVGIGTNSPSEKLQISDYARLGSAPSNCQPTPNITGGYFLRLYGHGFDTCSFGDTANHYPNIQLNYTNNSSSITSNRKISNASALNFQLSTGAGADYTTEMMINTLGNVGIGTNTPGSYRLAVSGSISAGIPSPSGSKTYGDIHTENSYFSTWLGKNLNESNAGSSNYGMIIQDTDGAGVGLRIAMTSPTSSIAAQLLGKVGIGFITTPSEQLEVAGNVKIDSPYSVIIPNGAVSGYVLMSDTNGRGSWQDPWANLTPTTYDLHVGYAPSRPDGCYGSAGTTCTHDNGGGWPSTQGHVTASGKKLCMLSRNRTNFGYGEMDDDWLEWILSYTCWVDKVGNDRRLNGEFYWMTQPSNYFTNNGAGYPGVECSMICLD